MRVELQPNTYTQINTNPDEYLIQNVSTYDLQVIVSDTQPADTADYDFVIVNGNAISNSHIAGTCWGKPSGKVSINVGVVEG
jgi:hypothetical protein